MNPVRRIASQHQLALVAAALLLPIPLLVVSGLTLPLPSAVARGIGSVVPSATGVDEHAAGGAAHATLERGASSGGFGGSAAVDAAGGEGARAEGRFDVRRSGRLRRGGAKGVDRTRTGSGRTSDGDPAPADDGAPDDPDGPPANPDGEPPVGGSDRGTSTDAPPKSPLGVRVDGAGQENAATVATSESGVTVNVGSGDSSEPGPTVEATSTDGSTTRVDGGTPAVPIP
jgi:hypothetical protein